MQDAPSKLSARQNMSRIQRFILVLGTWPCRLLKSKNRNESLLLIVIMPLKWFIERLSYSRDTKIDIFRDQCVSWSWYWDDHNAEKEGGWFIIWSLFLFPLEGSCHLHKNIAGERDKKPSLDHTPKDIFPAGYEKKKKKGCDRFLDCWGMNIPNPAKDKSKFPSHSK